MLQEWGVDAYSDDGGGLLVTGDRSGLQYTDSFWPIIGTAHAKATLEAGFTTVRNVGSKDFQDVGLHQAFTSWSRPWL